MGNYYCIRVWELKAGATAAALEALAASDVLEMLRWIPGVKQLSLLPLISSPGQYMMTFTFATYESYMYWRQVENEASDYWERYASVSMHWEQLAQLVVEYVGEAALEMRLDGSTQG